MKSNLQKIAQKLKLQTPSPIQIIESPFLLQGHNISVFCKRDDLIHHIISGNKWRKLAPFISALELDDTQHKSPHILSFGGGFSNHLHALGFVCHSLGLKFTAIVRGDYSQSLTPMLQDLKTWGVHCHFVNKLEYKERTNEKTIRKLQSQFQADLIIPEGGSSQDCLGGVAALVNEYTAQLKSISHVVLPVASGGTIAGIINRHAELLRLSSPLESPQLTNSYQQKNRDKPATNPHVIGIGVLKGQGYLEDLVDQLLSSHNPKIFDSNISKPGLLEPTLAHPKWHIEHAYHQGGYAKSSTALTRFISDFESATNIPIETVYSAKCFFALHDLIKKGRFAEHSKILIVHTGGMQGNRRRQN